MTSRASLGRVNEVLLLELLLPGPPPDDVRPLLENDVLREGGPDSPSVAPVLLGENDRGYVGIAVEPSRFSDGISATIHQSNHKANHHMSLKETYRPRSYPFRRCSERTVSSVR